MVRRHHGQARRAGGVSRQTVYNEVGSKPQLAEEMVLAELTTFLARVDAEFDEHPEVLADAIRAAVLGVLELARTNGLLQAIVSASYGAETELLPLLTTHAESLLAAAKFVVAGRVEAYDVGLDEEHLATAIDMVVRVVLSHVMQPSDSPDRTADDLAAIEPWLAQRDGPLVVDAKITPDFCAEWLEEAFK